MYASIALSLPRAETETLVFPAPLVTVEPEVASWTELLEEARDILVNREESNSIVPPLPPNANNVAFSTTLGVGSSRPV